MTPARFRAIVAETIDENPFACRALIAIARIEFTDSVPTLAVSCEAAPRLLVNLGFVARHCRTDEHVKAVICHEFLHVLLRHTGQPELATAAGNLACDAVINAIIHRTLGPRYSDFMASFYARERGHCRLLRRPGPRELERLDRRRTFDKAWQGLYDGRLLVDDIREIVRDVDDRTRVEPARVLLGSHDPDARGAIGPQAAAALDRALAAMNGSGIWRAPHDRNVGVQAYRQKVTAAHEPLTRWQRETRELLRRHLLPDPRSTLIEQREAQARLPVLSPSDRRSFARAFWSPLLPDATWQGTAPRRSGTAQVYLDVSGSMNREMPLIVALLAQLARHIRRPFWAFSDVVAPAVIRAGRLEAMTSGGTSMRCVLEHLAATRPAAAVVVTDGFIEEVSKAQVRALGTTRLHAVVTRDGTTEVLRRAGIPFTQLARIPA